MRFRSWLIAIICLLIFSTKAYAQNSFITIVNPVRISTYTKDVTLNLRIQYDELEKRELPATWLLTYEVIQKKDAIEQIKKFDKQQEIGIFLEITPKVSQDAGVSYNRTNAWHRATSIFLSGYSQNDRKKLIDKFFTSFKEKFGYYPKSVGSWWTDAYSLSYMSKKYGITGTLGVSDQYDLDGYQVWGTPWSTPYYPSQVNSGMPAQAESEKINVVMFRWAARDPVNGYMSPSEKQASLYSTQDYTHFGLTNEYYKYLISTFSEKNDFNKFGQITLGLESDYAPEAYTSQYAEWLDAIKTFQESGTTVTSMSEFANWYIKSFKISPQQIITTKDYLETGKTAYWINSNLYRVGLLENSKARKVFLVDFRTYPKNFIEPFYEAPNKQYNLSINLPYIIDSHIDNSSLWTLSNNIESVASSSANLTLKFNKGSLVFTPESIKVTNIKIPESLFLNPNITIKKNGDSQVIYPNQNYSIGQNGVFYDEYSLKLPFAIARRIEPFKSLVYTFLMIFVIIFSFVLVIKLKRKGIVILFVLFLILVAALIFRGQAKYYISQTEMDALSVLSRQPQGKVLVYEKDCLKCIFTTARPAAAAGRKGYVELYSKQKVFVDLNFQMAKDSKFATKILKENKVKYVYLSKYENYIETLPYLPQDLGLVRVYENANAQIFKVL